MFGSKYSPCAWRETRRSASALLSRVKPAPFKSTANVLAIGHARQRGGMLAKNQAGELDKRRARQGRQNCGVSCRCGGRAEREGVDGGAMPDKEGTYAKRETEWEEDAEEAQPESEVRPSRERKWAKDGHW